MKRLLYVKCPCCAEVMELVFQGEDLKEVNKPLRYKDPSRPRVGQYAEY